MSNEKWKSLSPAGRWLVVLAVSLMTALPAVAMRINIPMAVQITAYVDKQPEGPNPAFTWKVAHRRDEIQLYIYKLLVKTGNASAGDIDRAVYPYPIQFDVEGEKDAVQALTSAPAGAKVVIDAYLQFGEGARLMMLNKVETVADSTPAADAPATPAATP